MTSFFFSFSTREIGLGETYNNTCHGMTNEEACGSMHDVPIEYRCLVDRWFFATFYWTLAAAAAILVFVCERIMYAPNSYP